MDRQTERRLLGARGLPLTALYGASLLILYVGERLIVASVTARLVLDAVAAAGLLAAIALRARRAVTLGEMARPVERRILLCYLGGLAAVLLYAGQADVVMERLRPMFSDPKLAERYETVLQVLWPIVLGCSLLPLALVEAAYAPMDVRRTVELVRVRRSLESGLLIALTAALLSLVSYIASETNKKVDLSYFKTTRPSESSLKMVRSLTRPLEIVLFFPGANEVQDQAESYFRELAAASRQVRLEVVDHAMEPKLAEKYGARDNGTVILSQGKRHEEIWLGLTLNAARSRLRKLDGEFQAAFYRVARGEKIAYFTTGHEERGVEDRDKVPGTAINDLRAGMEQMNYVLKDLGLAEGLGTAVPKDAAMVIVAGPRKPFLPGEVAALRAYLRGGGRALIMLDPEAKESFAPLLSPFGLKLTPQPMAHDRLHARATFTPADRHLVVTNRFASHDSVSTLSRMSDRLAMVFLGAGALEEIPPAGDAKPRIVFTVHAMPGTWNDANRNFVLDAPDEKRSAYEYAAVVTMPAEKKGKAGAKDAAGKEEEEMRLVVVADSDFATDRLIPPGAGVVGNGFFIRDVVSWLGGEEAFVGETTSEEDVRIQHTRKEDVLWFYLTIFGVPALVLAAGIFFTRRRRRV